jgi:hypothetical protein
VYVINVDETGQSNVSNRPETYDLSPNWGGQRQSVAASHQSKDHSAWPRNPGILSRGP